MKTIYFDCPSGISGNMAMGALLDILGDEQYLRDELKKLPVGGYELQISRAESHGITGTQVNVIVDGVDEYGNVHHLDHDHGHTHDHNHGHSHSHDHEHRNLPTILHLIQESELTEGTRELASKIFRIVATAEARVHGKPLEEVHFHEVGAVDSIVDIVGTAILLDKLAPDQILASTVSEGHGFINCAHGKMSVPVPATSAIFAEHQVQFRQVDVDTELVTPTGAAILAAITEQYGLMPAMTLEKTGFGMGTKEIGYTNALKVYVGETLEEQADRKAQNDQNDENHLFVLETNIDDMSGELLGYTMGKLMDAGARDAFYTPIYMKKNRPAYKLEVICTGAKRDEIMELIFCETTTIGVRYYPVDRVVLERQPKTVHTELGDLLAKQVTTPAGNTYVYPEFESLRKVAEEKELPLKEIYGAFHANAGKTDK